ncbi:uncharacterized protein [Emydura macquarii macquarii]|uniref:uncharacterized protein n=1 Tax=Emydura macquarii macquarii TaxID=1129001 RepID=UPI00352A8921
MEGPSGPPRARAPPCPASPAPRSRPPRTRPQRRWCPFFPPPNDPPGLHHALHSAALLHQDPTYPPSWCASGGMPSPAYSTAPSWGPTLEATGHWPRAMALLPRGRGAVAKAHYRAADSKQDQFRRYLEKSGVLDMLTKVLVALHEEPEKPISALDFLKQHLGVAAPETPEIEALRLEVAEVKEKYEAVLEENKKLKAKLSQYEPAPEEERSEW